MICPRFRRRFQWSRVLRAFCACICVLAGCYSLPRARAQEKPTVNIDEDITAFALAPDGRIVYSVDRPFKTKQYDLEHDDIWVQDARGKRRRILFGEKFIHGDRPFTYQVTRFCWSPNGRYILAELLTTTVIDDSGKTQDSTMTLVLEDNGKEVRAGGNRGDMVIENSTDASWLLDSATIVYLTEILKPRILFSFKYFNIAGGPPGFVFEGRTFLAATYVPHTNVAIAVERNRNMTGPPRLQRLELLAQDDRELATLDAYAGGVSVSPAGDKVSYYIDKEVLEIRDVAEPSRFVRVRVGLGIFQWAPDGKHIFVKRNVEKKSGDLVWIDVPILPAAAAFRTAGGDDDRSQQDPPVIQPNPTQLLHGLAFRDFAISPDGRSIAVISPGRRSLSVYQLP